MRLIVTAIICSLLTVGGFFGYKQYQRVEMRDNARATIERSIETSIERESGRFDPQSKMGIDRLMREHLNAAFAAHYVSGGLTRPAEFDEVEFMRDIFERMHNAAEAGAENESTRDFARYLYIRSRPTTPGGFGGPAGRSNPPSGGGDPSPDGDEDSPEDGGN